MAMASQPARASPTALRALRDMAVARDTLAGMMVAVRSSAEAGLPPSAALSSMSSELSGQVALLRNSSKRRLKRRRHSGGGGQKTL